MAVRVDHHAQVDLEELRMQVLDLVSLAILALVFGILWVAAVDSYTRRLDLLPVLALLLLAAGLGRLRRFGLGLASLGLLVGIAASVTATLYAYPGTDWIYAYPLLAVLATVLFGEVRAFLVSAALSVWVVTLASQPDAPVSDGELGTLLFLIWATTLLASFTLHPSRTALDWAWRSFELAQQRTEELRAERAELGRVAKSLNKTCLRLEEINWELERARRAADEARRMKSEFAATVSHELRTPLNLVIGYTEMMVGASCPVGSPGLPAIYREGLDTVHRNALHILRLVDDVLDLSQIEANRMAMVKGWHRLDQVVAEATEAVGPLLRHLGLTLSLEVPDDLPPLWIDAIRIRQVLLNLLNNAARYTDRGGITVRVTSDDSNVTLSVSDTGVGISSTDLPYVFQEFRQVGPGDRRRGGNGLGLALCKRLVEMHGGNIWVESEVGYGTTFHLGLPLCDNVISMPLTRQATPGVPSQPTVAILDRGSETGRVLKRFLDGYQVVRVASVDKLIRLAASRPLRAIVYSGDCQSLSRQLASLDSPLRDLPVIACTLNTIDSLAEQLDVAEYLVKPVGRDQLATVLRRVGRTARDVLVVDDDPEMLVLLTSLVEATARRYRVRQARDGAEAMTRLSEQRPDLVLMDLQLPKVGGPDVIRQMKADSTLRDVPIVVITGRASREEAVRASVVGLSRASGLTIGEVSRWLQASLDALLEVGVPDTAPAPSAKPPASPAWQGSR